MEKSKLTKCCSPVIFQEGENDEICVFFIFLSTVEKVFLVSVFNRLRGTLNSELRTSNFQVPGS